MNFCRIQNKIIITGQEVHTWIIFEEPYIPPLREELHVGKKILFLKNM